VAKQVEDIVVRLVGEGFEALDKIKGSFRELGKVTNLAERDILSARDSLSDFAKKAGNTEAVNKGLIEAFKGLRSQVDINSAAYRSFSTDIARLETELRGSTAAIDRQRTSLLSNAAAGKENVASLQRQVDALRQLQQETRPGSSAFLQLGKDIDTVTIKLGKLKSEAQAFNLALGQQAGATPEVLNRQIATLQKGLQSVRFDAEQFVETLRKIQLLQITQTGRTGRAGVAADFEAYRSREFTAGYADPSRLAAMPDTTAALNQELSELTKRLDNVSRGGTDYVAVSLRIADIQRQLRTELVGTTEAFRQLDIAQTGADRRAGKLADIQDYYRTQGPTAPGVGGFRDPQTGAMIAAGSRLQTDIRPGTQYDQPIGPQPVNPAFAVFESNIKQSQDRITSIYDDAYVRRTQLQADYNQISIDKLLTGLDMEGQVRNAAFGRELADFDKQLEARDRRRRRRLTGSQLAQGAGAAISGGIFGGPEGLIGGLGGLAVGGVGGAFAGAAAGAQVGMFRQQLAGTADYAASIGKLQIALRGVVGSQAAYDAAIRAAAAATRDLNIPQEEATRGLTRLSAAVIGAGGTVADSSFAFRAMSEAIKATGGNAEQVDGALLALTQVFSKGKVSAEELNQIAERLPGTFTLFAQAAGKTGPELQKALEQGEVGLNDLMKFLALTGERYGATALEIAGSSQDAGARLTVAFQAMRLEVGKALQPLGAELQETFTAFIKDITPAVVGSAKAIAAVLSFFTKNEAAGGLARFALQLGAVALAIKGLQAASAGLTALNLASWFTTTAAATKVTSSGMEVAATKTGLFSAAAGGLLSVLSKLAALGIVTVGVTYIERRIKEAGGIQTLAERESAGGAARQFQGATREVVVAAQDAQRKEAYKQQQRSARLQKEIAKNSLLYQIPVISAILAQTFTEQQTRLGYEQRFTQGVLGLDPNKFPVEAPRSEFKLPSDEETKAQAARDKAARDAAAAAAEQQRLNEANAQAQLRLSDSVFKAQVDFDRKRFELQQELINRERDLRIAALTGVAAETASQTAQFFRTVDELRQRATQAAVNVTGSQQALQNAVFMRSVTAAPAAAGGGLPSGTGAPSSGGFTPQQLSSATTAASKFTGVANMCSESVKAFYKSLGITLPGVTAWADTVRKSGQVMTDWSKIQAGDIVATGRPGNTPHVGVYTGGNNVFHQSRKRGLTAGNYPDLDYFKSGYFVRPAAAAGRQATGVAAQQRRNAADQGDVAIAQVDFDMAIKYKALLEEMVQKRLPQEVQLFAVEGAKAYNAQSQALRDNVAELEKRQMLEMSSTRQEVIDGELQKFQLTRNYNREIAQLNADLTQKEVLEDPTGTKAAGINARIAATTQGYADQKAALDELTAAQIAFNDAQRYGQDNRIGLGMKEGALAYVESVGTMREATAQLTQNGIKGLEDQLFSLVTTGKANFQEFAAEILKQSARMILQLTIQQIVMQIIGAIGGGKAPVSPSAPSGYAMGGAFAKNNIIPYAMGGVVSKPTLFKFANGGTTRTGLMGEAGPEAIMPLSRGANGKLGVASIGGGGTTNVVVNVDASGNSQVAGDQNQGAQLGRVISQAVQAELVKQKRPGGLLAA